MKQAVIERLTDLDPEDIVVIHGKRRGDGRREVMVVFKTDASGAL